MVEILGRVSGDNLAALYSWVQEQQLGRECRSSYAPARRECWYGLGSNLQSLRTGRHRIFRAADPGERVRRLGDRLYPGWHSLLVCGGDTSISWHRDHGCFTAPAVMVNLGEAVYSECLEADGYKPVRWQDHHLTDGLVVRIDTKKLHRAQQISSVRYNVTFRCFKESVLEDQEF